MKNFKKGRYLRIILFNLGNYLDCNCLENEYMYQSCC